MSNVLKQELTVVSKDTFLKGVYDRIILFWKI